jgi:iron complex transport system ATP-binding protein
MQQHLPPIFSCQDLTVAVAGRTLVEHLSLEVSRGELIAVLGQNGSGKSLSLHTLAGLRGAKAGTIRLHESNVAGRHRQQLAKHLALGRHPHIGRMSWESQEDLSIARNALKAVDLEDLSTRDVLTLSGGERRRLAIAQVLTQTPDLYLLDEPTNHLDPQHQLDALRLFRQKADEGAAVIASLHDVNLAVRFADRCLLLFGDGRWNLGSTEKILNAEHLSQLYSTPMEAVTWRDRELFIASGDETL